MNLINYFTSKINDHRSNIEFLEEQYYKADIGKHKDLLWNTLSYERGQLSATLQIAESLGITDLLEII